MDRTFKKRGYFPRQPLLLPFPRPDAFVPSASRIRQYNETFFVRSKNVLGKNDRKKQVASQRSDSEKDSLYFDQDGNGMKVLMWPLPRPAKTCSLGDPPPPGLSTPPPHHTGASSAPRHVQTCALRPYHTETSPLLQDRLESGRLAFD